MEYGQIGVQSDVLQTPSRKEYVTELERHNKGAWDDRKQVSLVGWENEAHQYLNLRAEGHYWVLSHS